MKRPLVSICGSCPHTPTCWAEIFILKSERLYSMERRARLLINEAALSPSKRGNCAPLRYSARGLICIDMVNSFSFSEPCAHNIPGNSNKPNAK